MCDTTLSKKNWIVHFPFHVAPTATVSMAVTLIANISAFVGRGRRFASALLSTELIVVRDDRRACLHTTNEQRSAPRVSLKTLLLTIEDRIVHREASNGGHGLRRVIALKAAVI